MNETVRHLVIGISGASGVIYAVRLLKILRELDIETHLVITKAGETNIELETELPSIETKKLSTQYYEIDNLSAPIASGSFLTDGMVVIPCSMKTLAGIATGYSDNLLLRAADVSIKERKTLILVVRETPLSAIHLRNMLKLASTGVTIMPASPAFYNEPKKINDLVDYIVGKVLDVLNLKHQLY